ncbi:MAG TPA: hypothetical protein VE988_08435 [Gemmataceae bacterium]|nr:hypothetical protein [Gemmataceae bacterium]
MAAHFGDEKAAAEETDVVRRLRDLAGGVVVFRAGHIIGEHSKIGVWLRRFGFAYPLVPRRLRSCCVGVQELADAIKHEQHAGRGRRVCTILGPNRPWRDRLREHRTPGALSALLTGICFILAILLVGQFVAFLFNLLLRCRPSLRLWNFDTLRPRSFGELLALCNPHNIDYVKVVGYNNGIVHFGQRFPGKTVVSTVHCNRIVRAGTDVIKADCGATIRKATDFLAANGQELYVLPNYSYVCLGTAFFVPIHGSASKFSTVAETIVKVLLYDPANDRFLLTTPNEPAFREHVYNLGSKALVLRLWIQVKPKARYFVQKDELAAPDHDVLLGALHDAAASNVEIRKGKAPSPVVQICKFFSAENAASAQALEFPRDSLGRLWDRLEESPITSFLMHALTRHIAWHLELFFTTEEFALFWKTHQALPLRKIQIRFIRRDGWPHSPFCEHDCISVDLFMFRWHRRTFQAYLQQNFAIIRTNPGKSSQ